MSSIAVNAITDANAGNTATINSVTPNVNNVVGKNRIINGNMMIDQRNAGASVTIGAATATYTIDRWLAYGNSASAISVQQSTTAPTGFSNSMLVTSLAATSVGSTDTYWVRQYIEGYNVADLSWGTANAKTITVSFWVRSSLTGTFGGALRNAAANRSYPFTYTISVANTFEYKTITIAGDTSGTWVTTNGTGLTIMWGLGVGATYSGTAGSWAGANYNSATGATSVVGTNGATFYITGVQLEAGSSATEFEHRPYGTELQLCQRYFESTAPIGIAPANGVAYSDRLIMCAYATGSCALTGRFLIPKRAAPTITYYGGQTVAGSLWGVFVNPSWSASTTMAAGNTTAASFDITLNKTGSFAIAGCYVCSGGWSASSEL